MYAGAETDLGNRKIFISAAVILMNEFSSV